MAHLAHYKEAHPLAFVITHWINLVCMFVLIFTGFYIHYPFFPFAMGICRGLHVFCGIVVTLNCLIRIILAFFIKTSPTGGTRSVVRDFKTWLPQRNNRHMLIEWVKYYLFLQKDHPLGAKLGVPQKISYLVIPVCILVMAWTGFALWIPTSGWGISQFILNAWGIMNVRLVHFFVMFVIIIIMCFHIYLATSWVTTAWATARASARVRARSTSTRKASSASWLLSHWRCRRRRTYADYGKARGRAPRAFLRSVLSTG